MVALLASLLTCSDYDWLVNGVKKIDYISIGDKLELIHFFAESTNPECFLGNRLKVSEKYRGGRKE